MQVEKAYLVVFSTRDDQTLLFADHDLIYLLILQGLQRVIIILNEPFLFARGGIIDLEERLLESHHEIT